MRQTVFVELQFWLLVLFSLVLPALTVWFCLTIRVISRGVVLGLGMGLVAMAGVDLYLLQSLARMARLTPSLADDAVFDSEVTIGLYVLPALFAGIGVNVVSTVLMTHLGSAERRFSRRRLRP